MSKAGTNDNEDSNEEEEEEEEDEAEEEEHFYESLDRILSSSNSSTSASEDDDVAFPSPCNTRDHNHHHYHSRSKSSPSTSTPKFPMSAGGYDIWISDAAFSSTSVLQQRRDRLLCALGLSSDRTLSRSKQASNDNHNKDALFSHPGRSNSLDLHNQNQLARTDVENSAISCFKSEDCASTCHQSFDLVQCQRSSSSASTTSSTAILSIRSVSHTVNTMIYPSNYNNGDVGGVGSTHLGSVACLNEPSSDKFSTRMLGEIQSQSHCPSSDCTLGCDHLGEGRSGNNDGSGEGVDCSKINDDAIKQMCTIKNLDTGKEFVVNEVREDGMLQKLREVGTGRQLTMEEFEHCVGHSPIVQELMRRQNVECSKDYADPNSQGSIQNGAKSKKKVSWLKSIKNVASSVTGHKERRSSDEKDTSSEKCGGRRSSSATDDSQDVSFHGPERVRVRQYSKSVKEFTALYKSQDIQAHNGSIWCIKFSLDGRYLASAGEDCVIHVWQVVESERKGDLLMDKLDDASLSLLILANGSPELNSNSPNLENRLEKKRRGRASISRKSTSLDYVVVPEMVFGLSEKPICSFEGHSDDVLDLSWSKSQLLLSSSMDKTVRLWNLSSRSCLKTFSHSDYVTCIQFNPVDDRYFISGSLDAKVRIWSIPDRQVVDWCDLHEMVTAACYTPDGQGALVGSYKGSCRLYNASENKLQPKHEINLQNKKKKSHLKKITGFQFSPGSSSEVLITSADSRVRVVDGIDLVHKFKGFRNTNSQISASLTANGKYVVCASEDSHVYVWKHEADSSHRPGRSKGVTVTRSYEHFHCQDVSVAIPWPGTSESSDTSITTEDHGHQSVPFDYDQQHLLAVAEDPITVNHPSTPVNEFGGVDGSPSRGSTSSPFRGTILSSTNNYFFDRIAPTWPEEKLLASEKNSRSPRASLDFSNGLLQNRSAWGLVIVTAGLRGEIRTYQNFGLPVRT